MDYEVRRVLKYVSKDGLIIDVEDAGTGIGVC
jgi:hypothetical protein